MAVKRSVPRGWISIAELSERSGVEVHTVRRQLLSLNAAHGRQLLRSFSTAKNRKWFVSLGALRRLAPELLDLALVDPADRLAAVEKRLREYKKSHNALAARVSELEVRVDAA